MNAKNSNSGSDVSSNSSWTIIEETEEGRTPPNVKEDVELEIVRTTELLSISEENDKNDTEFVKVSFSKASIKSNSSNEEVEESDDSSKEETKSNGFLTFDEYLQERMLEHDYEHPNKSFFKSTLKKCTKFVKGKRKCKAETISVLSLCASILTVTGIALLCLTFPENVDKKNLETIKANYQDIVKNQSLDYNNVMKSFNKTIEVLNAANDSNLLTKSANSYINNASSNTKPYKRKFGPLIEDRSSRYRLRRTNGNRFRTSLFKNDVCYPKDRNDVCYPMEDPKLFNNNNKKPSRTTRGSSVNVNSTKTPKADNGRFSMKNEGMSAIEKIIGNASLKSIIKTILHDICLLKLITYLNNPKEASGQKSNKGERKASKRKLLEAIAEGMTKFNIEKVKAKRIAPAKRKNKSSKIPQGSESSSKAPRKSNVESSSRTPNSLVPFRFGENGKSECEKRFEDLDHHRQKSLEFVSKHRLNIQHIKERFSTEMNAIKTNEVEPIIRLHRMQMVRENYRLQLKKNRDIYLRELCKMKRLRSKMLRQVCGSKRNELEVKDASVGNYVVPINEEFQNHLQQLREKEVLSASPPNAFSLEKSRPVALIRQPLAFPSLEQISSKTAPKKKIPKLKRKPSADIPSVFGLSFNYKNLEKENEAEESSDEVCRPLLKDNKKSRGRLYEMAFEKKAELVKKSDDFKWEQQTKVDRWENYKQRVSKQDPEKCYKPNVMLYKF